MSIPDVETADQAARQNEHRVPLPNVPDNEMIAYQAGPIFASLRCASCQRAWMDQTSDRFAYRCLPLVIANQLGWDILNPFPLRARWLGGSAPSDVQVESMGGGQIVDWASGHFGEGVLTFSIGYLFRTPPGIRLLVTGPLNWPKPNVYPLSGVVETEWTHTSFTMNYQFTQPGQWVEFQPDEPICRIIPLSLTLIENLQGRVRSLCDSPELGKLFRQWSQARKSFNRRLDNPFSDESRRGWQKEYFQGQRPDGQRQQGHQTKLNHREFIDEHTEDCSSEPESVGRKKRQPLKDTQIAKTTSYDFLWCESRPFETRCRKCVQVMSAIARVVEQQRSLGGCDEIFLASYRRFCDASPEAFTRVCLEPRTYFWTRVGFQLIDALVNGRELSPLARDYCYALGATDVKQAVRAHLDRFVEFELAAAHIDGRDWKGQIALAADRPWSLPASQWTIDSQSTADVRAFCTGELSGQQQEHSWRLPLASPGGDNKPGAPRLSMCPVLDTGGCSIRLQPAALAGLGLAAVEPTIVAGDDYQREHASLIREALEAIRRYSPETFEQVRDNIRLIALKPHRGNQYTNVSISELPGAMMLTVVNHPLAMADRIIHEFHHHRLFSIEDGDPLLEPNTSPGERLARYYSPWRDDPRPIRGLLHGLYVFIAVGRFWQAIFEAADRSADQPYVVDQLLRIGKQLTLAHDILASNARFTPIGEGAFAQITTDVAALHERMRSAGLPDDAPALELTDAGHIQSQLSSTTNRPLTVAEAIDEHIARFEK